MSELKRESQDVLSWIYVNDPYLYHRAVILVGSWMESHDWEVDMRAIVGPRMLCLSPIDLLGKLGSTLISYLFIN